MKIKPLDVHCQRLQLWQMLVVVEHILMFLSWLHLSLVSVRCGRVCNIIVIVNQPSHSVSFVFLLGGNYTGWANFRSPFTLNSTHSKGSKTSNMILNVLMCAQFLCYNKSKGSFLLPITNLNFCFVPILLRGNNRGSSVNIPWNPCMRILENTRKIFHTNII